MDSKKKKFSIILLVITLVMIEVVSVVGLSLLEKRGLMPRGRFKDLTDKQVRAVEQILVDASSYYTHCPNLGWTIKKDGKARNYRANSAGLRGDREYQLKPFEGVKRVSTFGDSFTHCDNVHNEYTWQTIAEGFDADLEMLNFGVGGYGLDQAYLRYLQEGRDYNSHVVIIGFMSENIFRHVNNFRPFYMPGTQMPLAKPRFHIDSDKLTLLPNPLDHREDYRKLLEEPHAVLSELGARDHFYQSNYTESALDRVAAFRLMRVLRNKIGYRMSGEKIIVNNSYNHESEAFAVTTKILDEFYNKVKEDNATPIILVFPSKGDLVRNREKQKRHYDPLVSYLEDKGYNYIDLMEAFEKNGSVADTFDGHYSTQANRLVAEHIYEHLSDMSDLTQTTPIL